MCMALSCCSWIVSRTLRMAMDQALNGPHQKVFTRTVSTRCFLFIPLGHHLFRLMKYLLRTQRGHSIWIALHDCVWRRTKKIKEDELELATDRECTFEWACRIVACNERENGSEKKRQNRAALRDTTEIMQTKQLFDCRPVSVALVVHIFFHRCRHRVVDHGRHLVCLQIVLSHRCKVKRVIHWLCERHKSNSSHPSPFLFFRSLLLHFATRKKWDRDVCTRGHTDSVLVLVVTSSAQCHQSTHFDSGQHSATKQLFFRQCTWKPYAR